jgi:hypothetical protein
VQPHNSFRRRLLARILAALDGRGARDNVAGPAANRPVAAGPWLFGQLGDLTVASMSSYCLADAVAQHCWTGADFLHIRDYLACRHAVLHFATREEAEAEVYRLREEGLHLRAMTVLLGCALLPSA